MNPRNAVDIKERIRARGFDLGFDKVGFAPAALPGETERLLSWLASGHHGQMRWMNRDPGRRTDAGRSLEGARTVVCCALNYYQGAQEKPPLGKGIISTYAWGEDYHRVLERKLDALAHFVEDCCGVRTRIYVDTGPLLEKGFAQVAGLGWVGKHANLISRQGSSWSLLGEILLPVELPPDAPERDHCGTCSRCIAACPTRAIVQPYVVDSRRCISYLTIELRGPIPLALRATSGRRIFGCDDCQDVCPWNRFARKTTEAALSSRQIVAMMDLVSMIDMSREAFLEATRKSAIRRSGYAGLLRNVAVALGNSAPPGAAPALIRALGHSEALVRGHAAWALGRLATPEARARLGDRLRREDVEEVREEIRWALAPLEAGSTDRR